MKRPSIDLITRQGFNYFIAISTNATQNTVYGLGLIFMTNIINRNCLEHVSPITTMFTSLSLVAIFIYTTYPHNRF